MCREFGLRVYVEGNYSDTREAMALWGMDNLKKAIRIHSVFHSVDLGEDIEKGASYRS